MFEELGEIQLTTEPEIREGKNKAGSALKREEMSSEEPELPRSNPCDNTQSRNIDQDRQSNIGS
jgi:hypothetical protein